MWELVVAKTTFKKSPMTKRTYGAAMQGESERADSEIAVAQPRRVDVALLLSLCPGLGHQYAGYLLRGIILYVLLIVVSWCCAIGFMYAQYAPVSLAMLSLPFALGISIAIDACRCAKKQNRPYLPKWYNKNWIYVGVFGLLLVTVNPLMDMLIGEYIVRAYFVTSPSMSPTVVVHDLVVVNKLNRPARNDIVLIRFGKNEERGAVSRIIQKETLRRIIAVPGDKVEVRGRKVFVNAKRIQEPYAVYGEGVSPNLFNEESFHWGPKLVPKKAFFVLSDAREYLFDSRMLGFIERNRIEGIAGKIFWSWNFEQGRILWEQTAKSID